MTARTDAVAHRMAVVDAGELAAHILDFDVLLGAHLGDAAMVTASASTWRCSAFRNLPSAAAWAGS